jgi:hypothetical protein
VTTATTASSTVSYTSQIAHTTSSTACAGTGTRCTTARRNFGKRQKFASGNCRAFGGGDNGVLWVRLFWLQSKLAEAGAGAITGDNERLFLPVPCLPAAPSAITSAYSEEVGFKKDCLLFVNKESHYQVRTECPRVQCRVATLCVQPSQPAPVATAGGCHAPRSLVERRTVQRVFYREQIHS